MQETKSWQGLPYYPISQFYKQKFGEKVWKIPVSVAQSCPNREGLGGMKTCNFCDVWGSAAYPEFRELELKKQIEETKRVIKTRYGANKFLIYFQSYTNTFQRVNRLRQAFEVANNYDDICGFVVGTRPDCLSESVFGLWQEYSKQKFLSVELGVQTFNEEQLLWMRRGHTAAKSIWAINRIKDKCPNVDLGVHLMFGLKDETDEQIIETAKTINLLPVDNVKLHNLHILKKTPLEQDFIAGDFKPISREKYAHRVILFLQYLNPRISVHRLTAVASRHDALVAPAWAASKMESYQYILDSFKRSQSFQGQQAQG